MALRHKLYGIYSRKEYYACGIHCPTCKDWDKPSNRWKIIAFFPYHCSVCRATGNEDEFDLIDRVFVFLECKEEYKRRLKKLFKPA
jgi:hypothetical protein